MKKYYLFVLAAFISLVSADAQIVSSTNSPQYLPTPEYSYDGGDDERKVFGMIRAGVGTSKLVGKNAKYLDSKFGYGVDIGLGTRIGSKGFYWGTEIGFGSRGWQAKNSDFQLMAHNIKWTFTQFGWKIKLGDSNWAIDPHFGAYLSYDFAGNEKWESYGKDMSQSISEDDSWNKFDVGINVGGGFWFKKFNLDVTYSHGFLDAVENFEVNSSGLLVRLGFAF